MHRAGTSYYATPYCLLLLLILYCIGGEKAKQEGAAEELGGKVEGCPGEEAVFPRQERRNAMTTPLTLPEHPITSTTNARCFNTVVAVVVRGGAELMVPYCCVSRHTGWTGRVYSCGARIWERVGRLPFVGLLRWAVLAHTI